MDQKIYDILEKTIKKGGGCFDGNTRIIRLNKAIGKTEEVKIS